MSKSTSGLEDIFIKCPNCGHSAADHNQERFEPLCTGNGFKLNATACDCQRTYESIVNSTMSEPELQLLVIDLGGHCVVKVEKCNSDWILDANTPARGKNGAVIVNKTFVELREAIEQKPVPRIEQPDNDTTNGYLLYRDAGTSVYVAKDSYGALCQLAGNPLPVWKGGTWKQLIPFTLNDMYGGGSPLTSTQIDGGSGVTIWRFTQ